MVPGYWLLVAGCWLLVMYFATQDSREVFVRSPYVYTCLHCLTSRISHLTISSSHIFTSHISHLTLRSHALLPPHLRSPHTSIFFTPTPPKGGSILIISFSTFISLLITHHSTLYAHISHLTSHISHLTSHVSHLTPHASSPFVLRSFSEGYSNLAPPTRFPKLIFLSDETRKNKFVFLVQKL